MSRNTLIPRRRFLLLAGASATIVTGLPLLIGADETKTTKHVFDPRLPLMRNAAFTEEKKDGKFVLVAQTSKKETIAYVLDADAEFLWQNVPTGEEFIKGKKVTAEELAEMAVKKYPARTSEVIRKEVMDFLRTAYAQGVVVDEEARIYVTYKPAS